MPWKCQTEILAPPEYIQKSIKSNRLDIKSQFLTKDKNWLFHKKNMGKFAGTWQRTKVEGAEAFFKVRIEVILSR